MITLIMVLLLYGGLTYYIEFRGWQFIVAIGMDFYVRGYWIFVRLIAFSFFIARGGYKWLPNWLSHPLEVIGAYWLGIMTYLTMILALGELIHLLNSRLQWIPKSLMNDSKFIVTIGIIVISLVIVIVGFGWWNGRNPKVVEYRIYPLCL